MPSDFVTEKMLAVYSIVVFSVIGQIPLAWAHGIETSLKIQGLYFTDLTQNKILAASTNFFLMLNFRECRYKIIPFQDHFAMAFKS